MTISLNEVFMDLFIKYNLLLKLIYDYVNYSFNKNIVEIFYDFHVRRGKKVTCEYSRVQMLIETFWVWNLFVCLLFKLACWVIL